MKTQIDYIIDVMRLERDLKRLTKQWTQSTGLKLNELRLVVYIQQHPQSEMNTIVSQLGVTRTSLAQTIGELAAKGWLVSRPIASDRRIRVLSLTPDGRERMIKVNEQIRDSLASAKAERLLERIQKLQRQLQGRTTIDE